MTANPRVGDLALGKVLEIQLNGVLIGFPEGGVGFLHTSEIPTVGDGPGGRALIVGQEVLVKVIGLDRLDRPTLSLRRVTDQDRDALAYHREAIEFRSALNSRAGATPLPAEPEERVERRLEAWLKATDAALGRLKRRHGDRTSKRLELD